MLLLFVELVHCLLNLKNPVNPKMVSFGEKKKCFGMDSIIVILILDDGVVIKVKSSQRWEFEKVSVGFRLIIFNLFKW